MDVYKFISKNTGNYWDHIDRFVKLSTANRNASNEYIHMKNVAIKSIKLIEKLNIDFSESDIKIIVFSSWLLEISELKGESRLIRYNFIKEFCDTNETELIISIIECISYSKDINLDWNKKYGEKLILMDIVSDANKLQCLEKIGLQECIEYSKDRHFLFFGEQITKSQLKEEVNFYVEKKILLLKSDYIRTKPGINLSEALHDKLIEQLNIFNSI